MVSSVGTRCLQNSPGGNTQCKAGNKGLECRGKKPVLDAPLGNHIHPRAIWPGQVSQNQLLSSHVPRVSIYNILDLAKHKTVDDKAHEEGSFTSNFVFFFHLKQLQSQLAAIFRFHPHLPRTNLTTTFQNYQHQPVVFPAQRTGSTGQGL